MMKFRTILQYFLPHQLLSRVIGYFTKCKQPWFKNILINWFIRRYKVDLSDVEQTVFASFNEFFTRSLKPETRPMVQDEKAIACSIDGYISQIGIIEKDQIIQAKNYNYNLKNLISDDEKLFVDGNFATLYLSPRDYHRVHMPITGKLQKMIYVPGKLFSVNPLTVQEIPHLYTKNERIVTIFETKIGTMAMVLVGAMLVASIVTVWAGTITPAKQKTIQTWDYIDQDIILKRGAEMGRFQFGSTVILLFPQNKLHWDKFSVGDSIKMGQRLGLII
jgi:phosphatidylserine decarboxylase